MLRKEIAFFIFMALFGTANGQNTKVAIEKLKAGLKNSPSARKTASIYSDLTWYYANVSVDSALSYGKKAENAAIKLADSTLLAQVYSDIGAVYYSKGDLDNSEQNYLHAYAIRKATDDVAGVAKINNNLGNIYRDRHEYQQSMKTFLEALNYFEKTGDEKNKVAAKSNIGLLLVKLRDYRKAEAYLKESINYAEKNKLTDRLCEFYINLGTTYMALNDTVKAKINFDKSLKNCKLAGNEKAIAIVYQNLGLVKARQKNVKEAQALYEKSAAVQKSVNSDADQDNLKISMARNYVKTGRYPEALKLLNEIKEKFLKEQKDESLFYTIELLIPTYAYLQQPDSVSYYQDIYKKLDGHLTRLNMLKQTAELETKYQTAKKEKIILEQQAETRRKNILLIGMSVLGFFIVLVSVLIYRQQKLKNRQQEQEFRLKTAIAQIETQNKLQEQRLSISRDLHDNIGAQLTFIISSVDNIKQGFDIQNIRLSDKLRSISEFTKSTIVELRDTIWAMNNTGITFEDLKVRILNFIEKAKIAKEDIHFSFDIDERLSAITLTSIEGMNIYRTIQEAVNNAIKYANAENITIEASAEDSRIHVTVTDNGLGFDPETISHGNGLHNMRKRIEDVDGIFEIKTQISEGTRISISLKNQNT
ncbi:sensor histidine kinase [Flavobacterium sp.]|uniref:tetratricopeptide repeat-containing sensor histidine kinase n=1 Tax=Flavobacterium sp. TaxID=239 RepID=UPI0026198769|nr:sensor histidine kinase [Flavobacterium sp.]